MIKDLKYFDNFEEINRSKILKILKNLHHRKKEPPILFKKTLHENPLKRIRFIFYYSLNIKISKE